MRVDVRTFDGWTVGRWVFRVQVVGTEVRGLGLGCRVEG